MLHCGKIISLIPNCLWRPRMRLIHMCYGIIYCLYKKWVISSHFNSEIIIYIKNLICMHTRIVLNFKIVSTLTFITIWFLRAQRKSVKSFPGDTSYWMQVHAKGCSCHHDSEGPEAVGLMHHSFSLGDYRKDSGQVVHQFCKFTLNLMQII